jgi:hypothetical protein
MDTVEATGDAIKASAVLTAVLVVMLALTTGMVGWLFLNTVTHGEVIQRLESQQDWQNARLARLEKRLDDLIAVEQQRR